MTDIISIAGCPAIASGANAVLSYAQVALARAGLSVDTVNVRHLPAEELLLGRAQSSAIQRSRRLIEEASGLLIATSVHKFGYPGALKAFLDLLPVDALAGKKVLLFATAASPAQFLSCEMSLRAMLENLGVSEVLDAVYMPNHLVRLHDRQVWLDGMLNQRVDLAMQRFVSRLFGATNTFAPALLN